jgi:hypothetical protein
MFWREPARLKVPSVETEPSRCERLQGKLQVLAVSKASLLATGGLPAA